MSTQKVGQYLARQKSDSGDGGFEIYLDPGIYFVEVVDSSDLGSCVVTLLCTCDPDVDDYKTEQDTDGDVELVAATAGKMIRGGRNIKCSFSTSPSAAVDVLITRAS